VVSGAYYQHQRVATRSDFQSDAIVFETCFGLDLGWTAYSGGGP